MVDALDDVAPWLDDANPEGELFNMMADVALFEIDENGERTFDRFADAAKGEFSAETYALVERMKSAWFSLFRVAEPHEAAGLWLEDLLDDDRRVWVMDESLETSTSPNDILGMRLFDTGPFHAGFGIVVEPEDDVLGMCLAAHARRKPISEVFSLAALVYSNKLAEDLPPSQDELELAETFEALLADNLPPVIEHRAALNKPKSKRGARRKHRK